MNSFRNKNGQALITLLFFTVISISIASAAIFITLINSIASGKIQSGATAYSAAESGAENGFLQLLRNPNYVGEIITVNTTPVEITVSGNDGERIITSTATLGKFTRKVRVQILYSNGQYSVQSWKEVF